jgi:hypothetical protein
MASQSYLTHVCFSTGLADLIWTMADCRGFREFKGLGIWALVENKIKKFIF